MARRKRFDVSFGAKRVNPEDTLESGLPREMRNRPKGERRLAVKPSLLDYIRTVSEVAQGIRPENIPMTGMRAGKQLGPAIGGGLSALYDYARSTAPGQVVTDVLGAPARLGASIRQNPSMLYELIPGSGTVQGIREGAQRLAEGDPEAMRNAAALAAFAGAMDVIPGGGKGANLAVKGVKELAEEGVDLGVKRAVSELTPSPQNTETLSRVGKVTFDQEKGVGQVPLNQSVNYRGFTAMMRPSKFLELASSLEKPNRSSVEHIKNSIEEGKGIGSPFLDLDFETGRVKGHEGRHRMLAIQEVQGDEPVPVHIFGRGEDRARHLTSEDIESFRNKMTAQEGGTSSSNFSEAFHLGNVVPDLSVRPTESSLSVSKVPATATPAEEGVDLAAREALIGADSPFMISTRRPTPGRGGVNFAVYGNPDERLLVQSGEALRASPAAFAKNMQMLSEEPFAARVAGKSPEEIYDYATEQGARNLEFITNELMPPEKVQAAREWYPVAKMVSERAAERSGFEPQVGYGVTAVTSPQAPWDINVAKMERLLDLYRGGFDANPEDVVAWARRRMEDPKRAGAVAPLGEDYLRRITETPMSDLPIGFDRYAKVVSADAALNDPTVRRILLSGEYGEPYGPITWGSSSEINKALNILSDPTMANVSGQMEGGGKVPSFYNNIAAPFSSSPIATIDTHSAGAYSLFPGGGKDPIVYRAMGLSGTPGAPGAADVAATGSKGLYGPVVEAHRLAGERLGFLPREVQSATWEGVRDLWGQSGKTAALKKDIADIWRTSSSPDEARFRIAERLGKPLRRAFKVK